jgi:hypothetical protein
VGRDRLDGVGRPPAGSERPDRLGVQPADHRPAAPDPAVDRHGVHQYAVHVEKDRPTAKRSAPAASCQWPTSTRPGDQVAATPQLAVKVAPGSSTIRSRPERNALGGQLIGSTARLRRRAAGSASVSPVNTWKYGRF